jgi:hypothetical protein
MGYWRGAAGMSPVVPQEFLDDVAKPALDLRTDQVPVAG